MSKAIMSNEEFDAILDAAEAESEKKTIKYDPLKDPNYFSFGAVVYMPPENTWQKQRDEELLAQFVCALLPTSYANFLVDEENPSADRFAFGLIVIAEKVLEQFKKRTEGK